MDVFLVEVIEYAEGKFDNRYIYSVHAKEESAKETKKEILEEEKNLKKEDPEYEVDTYIKIIPMELLD